MARTAARTARSVRLLAVPAVLAVLVSVTGLAGPGVATARALPPVPSLSGDRPQYWFGNLRIAPTWKLGATGKGITVAVVDSGVQADTPELRGVVEAGTDLVGGDGRTDTDRPRGHGTSMARMIAGQGGGSNDLTGIAPDARIVPVVADGNGTAVPFDTAVPRGIRYAADHGAQIINISLGQSGTAIPGHCPSAVAAAVRYALGKNRIVVASAGNEGNTSNAPLYPAACPGVLAVGTVDGSKHAWVRSQRQSYVDVASPGVQFVDQTLAGKRGTSEGTSNSTALVSASLALIWSKLPSLTARQVVARALATTTDDVTRKGHDDVTGYGIVRPYFAITEHVPADAPNPVFDEVKGSGSTTTPAPSGPSSRGTDASPSSPSTGAATGPSAAAVADDDGTPIGLVAGIAAAVLLALAVLVVLLARRRRPHGPTGPTGPTGPNGGWPPGPPPPGYRP
ncbi:type VII secretion-associated serine protease mycosin [Jatrophihabitans endophyticus]|uniref:Type VII secretion-associated serine protease mycosin n=1 Tax=Jatrophihabitans endophyticus TaxID=1206085 RepID=A0A1M5LWP6_9ACTN|nr:S8 family serine peptidase [Jatrophihabitans endophyticus]SHG69445.1 type VII secretion-associated serine protease mycosin [Jatrophihabitans endophyticus]